MAAGATTLDSAEPVLTAARGTGRSGRLGAEGGSVAVVVDTDVVCAGVRELGVGGGVVIVHSSLSALGEVEGGTDAVVRGLLRAVGPEGTVVVPAFTPQVADPFPEYAGAGDAEVDQARAGVPLFHDGLVTPMGAIPNAVLGWDGRCRSRHPQASVAAVGARAAEVTRRQPLAYARGAGVAVREAVSGAGTDRAARGRA